MSGNIGDSGSDPREGLLEKVLMVLGLICVVVGAFEVVMGVGENAEALAKEGEKRLAALENQSHSVVRGLSVMAGSVVFFWMKRVLDLLGTR